MALNPNLHSTRSFFAFSPDLMACLNPEGLFQEVNPAWEKSLDFPAEALIGGSFLDLIFSEDRPKAVLEIQRLSRGRQETVSFETRIQDPQKKFHDIAWTCQTDPASESWFLIGRDMTDFRSLERAFSESLERFEKFSDSSTEGLAIHDQGVILEANQALARMFGFERASDLIGKNGLELTDVAGRETIQQMMREHWERSYEVTGHRRDGTTFPCQLRGREIRYRGKSARVSTFLDLTDLRGREKEISQSEEKFRCLSEAATEGVAITWQGKVLELNQALAGLLGYEPSEMIGRSVLEFTAPDSRERVTQMTLSEREEVFEAVGLHQNGARLLFQISSRSISFRGDRVRVSVFKPLLDLVKKEPVSPLKTNPSDEWIRESGGSFGKIFEEAFFGMALVDLNPCRFRQILRINPVFQKMLGYSEKDLVGKTMTDFCHPEDVPVEGGSLGRILDGESRREEMDKRYIRSDGAVVWVHVILIVIRGPEGEPLFGLAMAQDITQQREAEAARERSENRLRAVFNSSSQSLAVLDRQGRLEAFNPQAADLMKKIVGVAPVVGQSLGGTLAEPMLGFFSENFRKALQEGPQISERQLDDLDGESHWYEFQYYPVLDEEGKTTAVCLTTTLIDDRKKAEDSLRESEERFRRIFEDTSVGMTLVAQDKRFLQVNGAFCEMVGYSAEELKTKTFRDITHP
ncbi:MAG: PAS domain S-box protein, partial [bacterium]